MTTLHVLVFLKTLLNVLKGFYFNIQNIDKVSQQYHGRDQLVICNLSKVLDNFFLTLSRQEGGPKLYYEQKRSNHRIQIQNKDGTLW